MKNLAALLICCALSVPAAAADFDTTDKVLFGSFVALEVVDIAQTWQVHKHPDEWRESNPVYGSDPNMAVVIGVKALTVAGVYYLTRDMASTPRKVVLSIANAIMFGVVEHNYSVGIRIGIGI